MLYAKRRRKAYIAGPMRSRRSFNYPSFYAAEGLLLAHGWDPINPARMDRVTGDVALHQCRDNIPKQRKHGGDPKNARRYADRDLNAILALKGEEGDAIVLLEGWEESEGATAERAVGVWVGLRILTLREALA